MLAQRRKDKIAELNPSQQPIVTDAKRRADGVLSADDIARILTETQALFFKWLEYDTAAFEAEEEREFALKMANHKAVRGAVSEDAVPAAVEAKEHLDIASATAEKIAAEASEWLKEYNAIALAKRADSKSRGLELLLKLQMWNALTAIDDQVNEVLKEKARQAAEQQFAEKREQEEKARRAAEQQLAEKRQQEEARQKAEQQLAEKQAEAERLRLEAEKHAAEKQAEAERLRLEAEKHAAEKQAEAERLRLEAEKHAAEKRAEAERLLLEAEKQETEKRTQAEKAKREAEQRTAETRIQEERAKKASDQRRLRQRQQQQLREREAKEWRQDKLWKGIKIIPPLAVGGTVGFFAGAKVAATGMTLGVSAGVFIGCCTIAGAAIFLLAALVLNRVITRRPGFFPTRHDVAALDHEIPGYGQGARPAWS